MSSNNAKSNHRGREYSRSIPIMRKFKKENAPHYCCFCGKPIDLNLHYLDKWAFTVQHIVPLSQGGSYTDISNMAAAHRSCNSKEGNRLAGNTKGAGGLVSMKEMRRSRIW